MRFSFQAVTLFLVFSMVASAAQHTFRCRNLSKSSEQRYPSVIKLTLEKSSAEIYVVKNDENGGSLAKEGSTYTADRLLKDDEQKYKQPTFVVSDNSGGEVFANDERDTAILMFVEKKMLSGMNGKVTFWLHYNGGDYVGVDKNSFSCKAQ